MAGLAAVRLAAMIRQPPAQKLVSGRPRESGSALLLCQPSINGIFTVPRFEPSLGVLQHWQQGQRGMFHGTGWQGLTLSASRLRLMAGRVGGPASSKFDTNRGTVQDPLFTVIMASASYCLLVFNLWPISSHDGFIAGLGGIHWKPILR